MKSEPKGVYKAQKKNGSTYYRVSISHAGKHVSLGSYTRKSEASRAYKEAEKLYEDDSIGLLNWNLHIKVLPEDKVIVILNHRDNGMYIGTPIYLRGGYFSYFLKGVGEMKFDNDDLFYYSSHRIHVHDGHLYVNDYGMQYGILARYGIKNFAVAGKDYTFANGDELDYRYANIIVVNKYHGVTAVSKNEIIKHETKIHINGEFLIGRFETDSMAAVAYNKAVDAAIDAGVKKNFIQNYVLEYTPKEYASVYTDIILPDKYMDYLNNYDK
ncbi:MAG: hypothetical protein K6F00_08300 [Lachnospiraceae bacterium]|nr:hypothetical protein [Lachnospiraceae bacterium]